MNEPKFNIVNVIPTVVELTPIIFPSSTALLISGIFSMLFTIYSATKSCLLDNLLYLFVIVSFKFFIAILLFCFPNLIEFLNFIKPCFKEIFPFSNNKSIASVK